MGVRNVHVSVDSKLVANQVLGTYIAKEENMIKYLEQAKSLVSGFANFSIRQVLRSKNKKSDALSKIASTSFAHLSKQVLVEGLKEKSIQEREVATVVEEDGPTWMAPIMEYLKDRTLPYDRKKASKLCIKARHMHAGPWSVVAKVMLLGYYWPTMHRDARDMIRKFNRATLLWTAIVNEGCLAFPKTKPRQMSKGGKTLPDDKNEASKLRIKARQYELLDGVLYRRSFLKPWLSLHVGPWSMVAKAMRLGYYCPTMHQDAWDMIRKCKDCQIHRTVPRNPQQPLTPITAPWPFYKWGIDISGPFQEGPGKVKFLIVDIDYFTKWIEAKAVATISGSQVKKFVWDNIVCCFGLPREIVSDNGATTEFEFLEERREHAAIHEAKAKLKMTKYYNARVRGVTFRPGDFVYRSNDASHVVDGGKLGPKWEGPYEVKHPNNYLPCKRVATPTAMDYVSLLVVYLRR
ncbi:reverse transcriptase domain-containing protein [Tanacetum coccineum]